MYAHFLKGSIFSFKQTKYAWTSDFQMGAKLAFGNISGHFWLSPYLGGRVRLGSLCLTWERRGQVILMEGRARPSHGLAPPCPDGAQHWLPTLGATAHTPCPAAWTVVATHLPWPAPFSPQQRECSDDVPRKPRKAPGQCRPRSRQFTL